MKLKFERRKIRNLGNDIINKGKSSLAMLAAIEISFKIDQEKSSHFLFKFSRLNKPTHNNKKNKDFESINYYVTSENEE